VRPSALQQKYIPERRAHAAFLACGRAFFLMPPPMLQMTVAEVGWEHECVEGDSGGWSLLGVLRIHVGFCSRKGCVDLSNIK
jgi:hypothetical protein